MIDERRHQCSKAETLFWGLALIGAGCVFLLDRLDYADMHHLIRSWWPLFLVAMGLSRIVGRRDVWSGVWLVIIGAWLEAVTLHVADLTFRNSWPLLLVASGAMLVLRSIGEAIARRDDREVRDDR